MPRTLRISLVGLFAFSSISTFAQPAVFDRGIAPQIQYNTGIPVVERPRVTIAESRLVSQSHYKLVAGDAGLSLRDSSNYDYSGTRSGDPFSGLEFDTEIRESGDGVRFRSVQTFNPDNTVSGYRMQRWDKGSLTWMDLSRHVLVSEHGIRVSDTSWNWKAGEGVWVPGSYSVRQLNDAGLPVAYTRFSWNAEQRRFDSCAHSRSIYDAAGKLSARTVFYGEGHLKPATRTIYSYNERGIATRVRVFNWDSTMEWTPASQYAFQLDAHDDRIRQTHSEFFPGEGYRKMGTYEYRYDESRNVVAMTGGGDQVLYSYNDLGQCTGTTRSRIGKAGITETRRYYYTASATSVDRFAAAETIRVWPVPASGSVQFDVRALQGESYTATITSVDGRAVHSLRRPSASSGTDRLDLAAMPSGIYLLNVRSASGKRFQSRFTVAN